MKYEDAKRGYDNLWAKVKLDPSRVAVATAVAKRLAANRPRYEVVARSIGCPWWFIAAIHSLESGGSWSKHLHNGNPLTARTTDVPAGRPPYGDPPYSWEASALDALTLKGLDKVRTWPVSRCLYEWERYNGWGYLGRIRSPYLWADTDLEQTGKYVSDHVWDPTAKSDQCGAAAILKALISIGAATLEPEVDHMSDLSSILKSFASLAPTVATMAGGPLAGLVVKALAEALPGDVEQKPEAVAAKIEAVSMTELVAALKAAETLLQAVAPAAAPAPAPAPAVAPAAPVPAPVPAAPVVVSVPSTGIDKMFPGLTGWKTTAGVLAAGVLTAVHYMGIMPTILTPDAYQGLMYLIGSVVGVGAIDKIERLGTLFAVLKGQKTTAASQVSVVRT